MGLVKLSYVNYVDNLFILSDIIYKIRKRAITNIIETLDGQNKCLSNAKRTLEYTGDVQ